MYARFARLKASPAYFAKNRSFCHHSADTLSLSPPPKNEHRPSSAANVFAMYNILKGNTAFTNKVYQFLCKRTDNVLFSPLGLHVILTVMLQGARNQTADIIREVIQLPNNEPSEAAYKTIIKQLKGIDNVVVRMANLLCIKRSWPVLPQFYERIKQYFSAKIKFFDFLNKTHTVEIINEWVEGKTENKVRGAVDEEFIDDDATMLLVNAVSFKADWKESFSTRDTESHPFWLADGRLVEVEMMMHEAMHVFHKYSEVLNADVVSLPYVDRRFCFVVILPKEKEGIWDLEASLATTDLGEVTAKLSKTLAALYLPKFKMESSFDAGEILKKMGLGRIFDKETADFTAITPKTTSTEHLCVGKICQKVFIDVNEKGTDAASLTSAKFKEATSEADLSIVVDHPAIVMLEQKFGESKNILFYGRLLHPRY